MTTRPLSMPEELLLLSLRDRDGEFLNCWVDTTLGACLLGELLLGGQAVLERDRTGRAFATAASGADEPKDPLLRECFHKLSGARRRATVRRWVERFAATNRLRDRVAEELVSEGVVRCDDRKVLLFFHHTVYPEQDHAPEARLVARLKAAIDSEGSTDSRTAAELAVADAGWMLKLVLEPAYLKARRARIDSIIARDEIARELHAAMKEVEASITEASAFNPTIYSPPTAI
jgi:hypothetical protein